MSIIHFRKVSEMQTIELSIVIPCYEEEHGIGELVKRVSAAAEKARLTYELILVDDGSTDRTWEKILESQERCPEIKAVKLARNHGHQLALTAGMSLVRGEKYVFILDADLQDPPELLGEMIKLMEECDADVVYGKRKKREGESFFKLLSACIFYRFLRAMTDIDIPEDTGDFRLIRRHVADTLNQMKEHSRFIRGMVSWCGGKQLPLLYFREARFADSTKYPLRKMIKLALDAITAFSIKPLRIGLKLSAWGVLIALGLLLYALFSHFFLQTKAGWSSIMATIIFLGSLQLFLLGIMGEYLGRIFADTQNRPLFLIDEIRSSPSKFNDIS